jgi:RimJ/RimL family protein N-acetyltransferase
MQVFLETPRLVLRRFTLADVDNLVSLNADPDVMRFLTGGIPTGRDEIENELLPAFLGYYERCDGYGFWAAIEKRTGEFLGCFYLTPQEGGAPDEVELGFRLRKSAWGKGYATEGARALIRRGFTESGVQCIVADTMAVNIASRRVLEKAGLKLARTYHQPGPDPIEGGESGDVEYALHRADWEHDQAGPGRAGAQAVARARPHACRQRAETRREASATRGSSPAE